jgi:hypothetical protein
MAECDGPQAYQNLLHTDQHGTNGACWYFVWQADAKAGAATSMGSFQYAYDAAFASMGKHYDMNPPEGACIWLGERYDGNRYGDVFIAGSRTDNHVATDQPRYGAVGLTTIQERMNLCGREYLFWTDHVLDCPIEMGGSTPPAKDDEMPKLKTVDISLKEPQRMQGGTKVRMYINDDKAVSLFSGPHDVVDGDLYIHIDIDKRPDNWATIGAAVQITPTVEDSDGGNSHSLGAHELPVTSGSTMGHIPLPPVKLGDGRKVRYHVLLPNGFHGSIAHGEFRGRYWD